MSQALSESANFRLEDLERRTPESHLKGVFQHLIFAIPTFFQNPIRIPEDIEVESEVPIHPLAQAALLHPF